MTTVLLVIHVMLALTLIGIILIQKSEGGGLGIGGGSGMSGFMTGRSQANLLTRTTAILGAGFVLTSIALAMLHARSHAAQPSLLDQIPVQSQPAAPGAATPPAAPAEPVAPAQPGVPLAK